MNNRNNIHQRNNMHKSLLLCYISSDRSTSKLKTKKCPSKRPFNRSCGEARDGREPRSRVVPCAIGTYAYGKKASTEFYVLSDRSGSS